MEVVLRKIRDPVLKLISQVGHMSLPRYYSVNQFYFIFILLRSVVVRVVILNFQLRFLLLFAFQDQEMLLPALGSQETCDMINTDKQIDTSSHKAFNSNQFQV